jgi:hypothetical protein
LRSLLFGHAAQFRLAGWPTAGSSAEKGRSGTKFNGPKNPAISTQLSASVIALPPTADYFE